MVQHVFILKFTLDDNGKLTIGKSGDMPFWDKLYAINVVIMNMIESTEKKTKLPWQELDPRDTNEELKALWGKQ